MKLSDNLKNRLSARSQIRTAHSQIKTAKEAIIMSTESNSWENFKAGNQVLLSNASAKATIALAVQEFNALSGGKPLSCVPSSDTPSGENWNKEKAGNNRLFYTNRLAQGVLKIAAAEIAQLAGVQAPVAAAGKPAAVSVARPAAVKPAPVAPAAGGNGVFVATQKPTLSKADFDALTPADKMRFSTTGGRIIENEEPKPHSIDGILTRAGLAAMNPTERMAHFQAGGKLVD